MDTDKKVELRVVLTQAEAHALQGAIDVYFYSHCWCELDQEMHEKVSDRLIAAGYDPETALLPP